MITEDGLRTFFTARARVLAARARVPSPRPRFYPRHRYDTRCQYCRAKTGVTLHAWATEDICPACVAIPEHVDDQGEAA